jgi:hypothetical protein
MGGVSVQFASERLESLQRYVSEYLGLIPEPDPEFKFLIGWCRSYEALFQGEYSEKTAIEDLVGQAAKTGRVLVSSKGGAAKSVIFRRLARMSLKIGHLAVILDLKKWSSLHYTDWRKLQDVPTRINYLFSSLQFPQFSVMQLDALSPEVLRLIFVDGLNEVTSDIGQEIIRVFDEYAQYAVNTGIIVSDRMVRRTFLDPNGWRICTVLPLEAEEIKRILALKNRDPGEYDDADPPTRALLSTPYFLHSLLSEGTPAGHTSSETIRNYFVIHASLSDSEIDKASKAAYHVYEIDKSRTFTLSTFSAEAGGDVTKKLIDTDALLTANGLASFDHHLKHDFLASRYVVEHPAIWSADVLEILTFKAGSFDALFMALQQMPSTELADRFVREIYDWNLYGAAYALTEGGSFGATRVSHEMQTVIITMLAERQWDLIKSTQVKAKDALSLFPSEGVSRFVSAESINDLFPILDNIDSANTEFQRWRSLFTIPAHAERKLPDLELVKDKDSLLGWTFANVLKRLSLPEASQRLLRSFIDTADRTVRWRIVHVLGSFPNSENAALLFTRLDSDDYHWVRYGAARSLIELAAIGKESVRKSVLTGIRKRAAKLISDAKTIGEFESAIFIDRNRAPKNWVKSLAPVIETLYGVETTFEKRERWKQVAYRLKGEYGFTES